MGQNQRFLNLLKNSVTNSYWICSIIKTYILCCVPAQVPYLGEFLFLRYGPKCSEPIRLQNFLISHISRTNRLNSLIFCMLIQIHINEKLIKKFWDWHGQKWVWPVWSRNCKIDFISKMNWWNELIFYMLLQFRKVKSYFNYFSVAVHETLKSAVPSGWVFDWDDF